MANHNLEITVITRDKSTGEIKRIKGSLDDLGGGLGKINNMLGGMGLALGAKELFDFGKAAVDAALEAKAAEAELQTALESTGQATEEYKSQLDALATSLEDTTLFTDEAIQKAEASLVTYKNLGQDIMPRVVSVVADMGQKMGNLGSAAELAGKLLNDPVEAMSRAERQGILFTEQQKAQITAMVEANNLAGAQSIILDELTRKFGGQATAAREAAGRMADWGVSTGRFTEEMGNLLLALSQSAPSEALIGFLDRMTEGAKAWTVILEQQVPAIEAHNLAVDTQVGKQLGLAQSLDDVKAAMQNSIGDYEAMKAGLIGTTGSFEDYNAALDRLAAIDAETNAGLGSMIVSLSLTAEEFDAMKESAEDAQLALINAGMKGVTSLSLMGDAAVQAAGDLEELARIGDTALAITTSALDAQAARMAGLAALSRTQGAAGQDMLETMGGGSTLTQQEAAALAERNRLREEADRESEQASRESTQRMADNLATSISGAIGSAITSAVSSTVSENSSDVIGQLMGLDNAEANAGEAVRRMAAVAGGGIQNEWAPSLAAQLTGIQDKTAQAFVTAFSTGDDAALKAAAQQLALNPIVALFDANVIATQVEQQLTAQNLQQLLNDKVNAILGEKGLPAVVAVSEQVATAATDTGTATAQVQQSAAEMAGGAEAAGEKIKTSFDPAIAAIETLNRRMQDLISYIERAGVVAQNTAGSIAGLNPPAAGGNGAGVPTDAERRMGGAVAQ